MKINCFLPCPIKTAAALLVVGLLCTVSALAGSIWTLASTPVSETFNGVSIGTDGFKVMVGNSGAIVHVDTANVATTVVSGTTEDLFDVYVVDQDFAVAVGRDVGLIWDGTAWSTFLLDDTSTVYTSVWASPEKDVVIFNIPGAQFSFHRAYFPPTDTFRPGSLVSGFDIGYCGSSNDIKSIIGNGSITNFGNDLGPVPGTDGTFSLLYDNSLTPLNLTAAWFPPGACIPGVVRPFDGFAIHNNRGFYRFDPATGWSLMPVDGGSIPTEHILSWLGGTGPDNIVAVGFKPNMSGGNDGVLWRWDGQIWSEDLTLPAGTPGLTDVAARFTVEEQIFEDGFESIAMKSSHLPPCSNVDFLAPAENGASLFTNALFPAAVVEPGVEKELRDLPPFTVGQTIVYFVTITNHGPDDATNIQLSDSFGLAGDVEEAGLRFLNDDCGSMPNISFPNTARNATFSLAAGEMVICRFEFEVIDASVTLINSAFVYTRDHTGATERNSLGRVVTPQN